jgi:hypothetical protein
MISPSIKILMIVNRRTAEGILETVSMQQIVISENLTIGNEEETAFHPGDWNIKLFAIG